MDTLEEELRVLQERLNQCTQSYADIREKYLSRKPSTKKELLLLNMELWILLMYIEYNQQKVVEMCRQYEKI